MNCLTTPPILAYPEYEKDFILHVDASEKGLGAVLYQEQEKVLRVIGYGSRTLSPAERNYYLHSGKLEFMALRWAVTEQFRDYLYYAPHFRVYTDNNPLTYVQSCAKLNATQLRWVGELANYHFSIHYRPGKAHIDADTMSRLPFEEFMKHCTVETTSDAIKATFSMIQAQADGELIWVSGISSEPVDPLTPVDIKQAQEKDPSISVILEKKRANQSFSADEKKTLSVASCRLLSEWKWLSLIDGILYRKSGVYEQLVVLSGLRRLVHTQLHDEMGHLGIDRVLSLARERFHWPHMKADLEHYVTKACRCLKQKPPSKKTRAPMQSITTTAPLELVSIDFMHLERSSGGYEYILLIVDHFTRYSQAYATRNKLARTVESKLYDFILRFGYPAKIHHDQGKEFENDLFRHLEILCNISHSRTTPYHPQGNGQVERYNHTILSMLRIIPESKKSKWKDFLNKVVHSYNCTQHEATGYSPFFLMFGRHPRLPSDLVWSRCEPACQVTYPEYVTKWRQAMEEAYALASERVGQKANESKRHYDIKVCCPILSLGDRVLVRNLGEKGGLGKLRAYWEDKCILSPSI